MANHQDEISFLRDKARQFRELAQRHKLPGDDLIAIAEDLEAHANELAQRNQ
jgi:hypothetical protein